MTNPSRRDILRLSALVVGASPLASCGGGSGGAEIASVATTLVTPPPPPPPTSSPSISTSTASSIRSTGERKLSLLSTTTQTAPFSVGFAFRQGDIPSGSGVSVSGATAQVLPKNVWPDGSLKFATVSGHAALTGNTPLSVTLATGASLSGAVLTTTDLRATGITSSIGCGAYGTVTWVSTDWDTPFQTWDSGPYMSSWIYRKSVGSDPHLVAWLEVRLYAGGEVDVLPWIENGYLLVTGPTSKAATFTFALGGTARFSASIDLPHHCRTPLLSGTITSHWLGTAYDVIVKHDRSYFQSTGMVPTYLAQTDIGAASVTGLPATFTPLQQGGWPTAMGSGGYSASIGLLPEWDVVYLTSDSTSTYKGVVFNGYSTGRYPTHYRDESNGNRPARLSLNPMLNIREPSPGWLTTPATSGTAPPGWDPSHEPSAGFMAYLVTGRPYFLDELHWAASTNALMESSTLREAGNGFFKTTAAGAVRHVAWCWRTLAQAVAATPDSDTLYAGEYRAHMARNVGYYHARYIAQSNCPQGFVEPYSDYNGGINPTVTTGATTTVIPCAAGVLYGAPYNLTGDNQYVGWRMTIGSETRTVSAYSMATETLTVSTPFGTAPSPGTLALLSDGVYFESSWMQDFLTASWGYSKALAMGLDGTNSGRLDALFAWKCNSIIGRLGTTLSGDYIYRDYGTYAIAVAPSDMPDFETGTGPWFADWGKVYDATFAGHSPNGTDGGKPPPYISPGPRVEGDIRLSLSPEFPGANALPAIAYAVKYGITGALAAYQRLTTASNWPTMLAALDTEPVWAVAPG